MNNEQKLQVATDALKLAQSSYGAQLTSYPPQSAWEARGVSEKIREAIANLAAPSTEQQADDTRREFVAYWRARYQYSQTHAFLDEFGNFCTPGDDPIHMGWDAWQAGIKHIAQAATAGDAVAVEIDWPACNPACDYEDPHGGQHDCRSATCSCEPAKASVARQRAATQPAGEVLTQARYALEVAMQICDAVPTRLQNSPDLTLAHIGELVNARPDGQHGYAIIRDALLSVRNATPEFLYQSAPTLGPEVSAIVSPSGSTEQPADTPEAASVRAELAAMPADVAGLTRPSGEEHF